MMKIGSCPAMKTTSDVVFVLMSHCLTLIYVIIQEIYNNFSYRYFFLAFPKSFISRSAFVSIVKKSGDLGL
jgi:hypothetical protein